MAAAAPTTTPTIAPSSPAPGDPPAPDSHDIEAIGTSVTGRVNSIVRITMGIINHGPAVAFGHAGVMGGQQGFRVTLPAGVRVVGDPHGCENRDLTFPFSASRCDIGILQPGESLLLVLDVKLVGSGILRGRVFRFFIPGSAPPHNLDRDPNPANNAADIVIRVSPSGPVLADTGSRTGALVAAGGAAVVIGTLLLIVSRRRLRSRVRLEP